MVAGVKRSGMAKELAEHIAEFAYEYSKGFTLRELKKFRREI